MEPIHIELNEGRGTCLMKLLMFLCLKKRGKTTSWNLEMSLMMNSLPLGAQKIILLNSSFCVEGDVR